MRLGKSTCHVTIPTAVDGSVTTGTVSRICINCIPGLHMPLFFFKYQTCKQSVRYNTDDFIFYIFQPLPAPWSLCYKRGAAWPARNPSPLPPQPHGLDKVAATPRSSSAASSPIAVHVHRATATHLHPVVVAAVAGSTMTPPPTSTPQPQSPSSAPP